MLDERDRLFIGGEWVPPQGSGRIEVVSPATEAVVGEVPEASVDDVDAAVAAARRAFDDGPWPRLSPTERADALQRVAAILHGRTEIIARTISTEVGTPISLSTMVQAMVPLMFLDYYIGLAREFAFEELRSGPMGQSLVVREPVGVVAAIVPWNYPLYLTIAKIAPALVAGCTVVLKPAPESPLNAFLLADAVAEAGLPEGVFNLVPAGREVGERLVTHRGVDKVSFTGSTNAGRRIMSLCGDQVKRVTLELGGKSACILLDDAPLDMAIPMSAQAAMINSGQTCIAQTRLLVPRASHDDVVERMADALASMTLGDPLDPATTLGPLVSARQRERVEGYIELGQEEGAKVVLGGGRPAGLDRGYYVEPTLFVGVDNGMRIAQEEIFGPVLAVVPYDSVDEAVALANDSEYGLSGAVWSADPERGLGIARRIRTGTFAINGLGLNPAAPFGGFKQSGIGRELGPEGLQPYLETKSVSLPAGFQPGAPAAS